MRTRFWIHSTMLVAASAIAAALAVPSAEAQQFSPWSAPVNLNNLPGCPAVVNSTSPDVNDTHPAISKDGLSLYFASTWPGPNSNGKVVNDYDLWVTQRPGLDACWGPPVNLGTVVNSPFQDFAPNLSPDGQWLFFHSKQHQQDSCGTGAVNELWAAYRTNISINTDISNNNLGWQTPINLGCATNGGVNVTTSDNAGPNFFDDGTGTLFLYFTRNAFPGDQQGFQIYVSTCSKDIDTCNRQKLWGPGTPVGALNKTPDNKTYRNTRTAIRRDGLEMILSSGRPGSLLSENLWVSTRDSTVPLQDQNWAPPEPVNCDNMPGCSAWNPQGAFVNSNAFDGGPALSWDGTELYFFRVKPVNATGPTALPCTEGDAQEPLDPPDTGTDIGPFCRDLYVSKRTYITKTVLNSSANPSVVGQSVTFSATVSSANDSPPTGTVKFSDGSNDLVTSALTSGQATFTTSSLSIGSHSITGQYGGDRISSASSGSLSPNQDVEYAICPLFDQSRSVKSGATFPIKLQLCDANGNDLSSSAIVVQAMSVSAVSGFSGTPDSPGNANPDNDFRFDATLGSTGGYIFNLSTGGLASGTYGLQFTAGSDPVTHSVNFAVN